MPVKPKGNNRQHQSLTTALRNIIREYPSGGGVLRELTQNADDAGASTIEFVLDETHHPCDPLLHPDLADFHGPSLLAYNDKPFSEKDFRSLSRIGDSEKARDLTATGKFGRGFNSVYNWTDGPSILSGSSLLILDPHESWSADPSVGQPGGPLYDFVENAAEPDMVNQLSPFRSIVADITQSFDGTVIRIPLRTADQAQSSRILDLDRTPTGIAEIKDIFEGFAEELSHSLLFLRNVSSITLRIGDQIFAQGIAKKFRGDTDITASFSINEPYQSVLVRGDQLTRNESYLIEVSFRKHGSEAAVSRYALTHHMRRHVTGNTDLEEWARTYKLLPWIAIASPLSQDAGHARWLFSTLPLPVPSRQPAHIHGMFSIRPDRSTVHTDDSSVSSTAESGRGAQWNRWLFKECVVDAWVNNLQFIQELSVGEPSDMHGWSHWPSGFQEYGEQKHLGTGTLGAVFTRVVNDKRKLLPTICGTAAASSDALFAGQLDGSLRDALRNAGVVAVQPPSDRLYELTQLSIEDLGMSHVSPKTIRDALTTLSGNLEIPSTDARSVLLDYILSDGDYDDVGKCKAQLLPMMDGTYRNLGRGKITYRFSRDSESSLFTEMPSYTIDCSRLSPGTVSRFTQDMDLIRRSSNIGYWDLCGARLNCELMFSREIGESKASAVALPGFAQWLNRFWSWVISIAQQSPQELDTLNELWLVPLTEDLCGKLKDRLYLNISGSGPIANLFRSTTHSHPIIRRLYSGSGISPEVTVFLNSKEIIMDCDEISALLRWLRLVPDFFDTIEDSHRIKLIECIGDLAKRCGNDFLPRIWSLPLFRLAHGSRKWIRLDDKSVSYVAISISSDSLPTLHMKNTVFIERDFMPEVLLQGCVDIPPPYALLEKYIMPGILNPISGESRTTLSKHILRFENVQLLSAQAKKLLSNTDFIPTGNAHVLRCPSEVVDPQAGVAKLYFDNENVFPVPEYSTQFSPGLKMLGMITKTSPRVVLERLEHYSKSQKRVPEILAKVKCLLENAPTPPTMNDEDLELRWIPASSPGEGLRLCSPTQCRHKSQELYFKYSMPLTDLDINTAWKQTLKWFQTPKQLHVLKQLDEAVKRRDNEVLSTLLNSSLLASPSISKELDSRAWIPGTSGGFYRRNDIFQTQAGFHPYTDTIAPHYSHMFGSGKGYKFEIEESPSFHKLRELHDVLVSKGTLGEADLDVFVLLLNAFAKRFPRDDLTALSAPDESGFLRRLTEITAGDGGSPRDDPLMKDLVFVHPKISPKITKCLKIPTIQERFLEKKVGPEFIQGFEQEQDLQSLISDTLQRYPLESTFSEYLANAEDSGAASKICWVADETDRYPGKELITAELSECQGPALFCYNDGVFTEKDFQAVTKIGVGSKRDETSKIGRFGRGSLTMYHWTCTPSYISGEDFVIFDPEQKRLPFNPSTMKRRKGMRMKIKDVRLMYPDQLQPFYGLFDFTAQCNFFQGTLFRFPIMGSRALSPIFSTKTISLLVVESTLQRYYNDASISLLFLKNMQSIEFYVRPNTSAALKLEWRVGSSKQQIPGDESGALSCRIESYKAPSGILRTTTREPLVQEWVVISSTYGVLGEDPVISATQERHKVQARCGVAAPIPQKPIKPRGGRLFMDVPMQHELRLPVSISADFVVQSDRKTLPSQGQDGATWNRWLVESKIAPLYALLLEVITNRFSGCDGYMYWPTLPQLDREISEIGDLISNAFWELVPGCDRRLFLASTEATMDGDRSCQERSPITVQEARFDLREGASYEDQIHRLVRKLDLGIWKAVAPRGAALEGLRILAADSNNRINVISPDIVLELFRSKRNSDILYEIWKTEYQFDMEYINGLLRYSIKGATAETLKGCWILPAMNNTLEQLQSQGASNAFFVPPKDPALANAVTSVFSSYCVRQGIDEGVLDCLIPEELQLFNLFWGSEKQFPRLNLFRVSEKQFPRLVKMASTKSPAQRHRIAAAIWQWYNKYNKSADPETLEILRTLPIIATFKARNTSSSADDFITLADYTAGKFSALIQCPLSDEAPGVVSWNLEELNKMLSCFADLSLIRRDTFPNDLVNKEYLSHPKGLCRFLRCIERLAAKKSSTIECFIENTFRSKPELMDYFRRALNYTKWSNIPADERSVAQRILRQIPILPSGQAGKYLSAQKALIAPSTKIDLHGLSDAGKFVDSNYVDKNKEKLQFLDVTLRISVETFLDMYLSVSNKAKLDPQRLDRHVRDLGWISSDFKSALIHHPVAVNGVGNFCTANTLFDHDCTVFQAAFHHRPKRFLHQKIRRFGWEGIIKGVELARTYRKCARGIVQQAAGTDVLNDIELIKRAKIVFGFLKYETRGLERVCSQNDWELIVRTEFVPTPYPEGSGLRSTTIRRLAGPTRLITLVDGVSRTYSSICWSQKPVFSEDPCSYVLTQIPGRGRPTPETVFRHLRFMSKNAGSLEPNMISDYVGGVVESYRYLQSWREPFCVPDDCADSPIWFNADEKDVSRHDVFRDSWISTKNLCLGLEYDSEPLQQVRAFLKPFIELLEKCKVREITGPRTPPPVEQIAKDYSSTILSQFQAFRNEERFFDLEVSVERKTLRVHKAVLCAASKYFQVMFTNGMKEAVESRIELGEITENTAIRIFDYIYTGEMTPITPSDDPAEELEQLLDLLEASTRFLLPNLKSKVEYALCDRRYIRPETVTLILETATELDAEALAQTCDEYKTRNIDIVERAMSGEPALNGGSL